MTVEEPTVEEHPLEPFLPEGAKLLMLGSFPPQRKRWSMEFYYPNFQNDMWRIMGFLFYGDREYFTDRPNRAFRKEAIMAFAQEKGIAFYDTASAVKRLRDNASDKFLEVVRSTDAETLLRCLPQCHTLCVTGEKAADTLCTRLSIPRPPVAGYSSFDCLGRAMRLYRMPSSSRAYPMTLEKKAALYRTLFQAAGIEGADEMTMNVSPIKSD